VGNNLTPALRNGNIAGQEVPEPCLVRVLVCMNEDCHRELVPLCLVGAERKGPHPRSIDAANVSDAIYSRNSDRLMLFWHLRESRRASDPVRTRSDQAALFGDVQCWCCSHHSHCQDHRVEDAGLALAAVRDCGQRVGLNRALWEALT